MSRSIEITNTFETIQGEGKYMGYPTLFIRTTGCNLRCPWCDTKYAYEGGKKQSIESLVRMILRSKLKFVTFTGGEPLLWCQELQEIVNRIKSKTFTVETNGTILNQYTEMFDYVCFSPKKEMVAADVQRFIKRTGIDADIKVVTDLNGVGSKMLNYATMLMPLTTYSEDDQPIRKKVWNYCVKHNIRYCPRLHVDVWGTKRGK